MHHIWIYQFIKNRLRIFLHEPKENINNIKILKIEVFSHWIEEPS